MADLNSPITINEVVRKVNELDAREALPSQIGNTGKFLTTDGTNASWAAVPEALPNQVGNSGKALYTDGQDASWEVTRDPNTYRSLSTAQEAQLLADGTYNGVTATSGEIFTAEDGTFKEFTDTVTFEGVTMLDYDPPGYYPVSGGCFKGWAWAAIYYGDKGGFIITKDNGLNWLETGQIGGFPGSSGDTGYALTDDNTLYFMQGPYQYVKCFKTTDGETFTQFNIPSNTPTSSYINTGYCSGKFIVNKFVSGSDSGYVYSDDPSTGWTVGAYPAGVTSALMMIFSDSVYLIDEDTKRVYKTLPGDDFLTSWTDTGYNSNTTRALTNVSYSEGLYVVNDIAFWMGNSNLEYSLDNGITWTQTSLPIKYVYYCKDTQTYIGLKNNDGSVYYTSTDGINWQQETVETGKSIYTGCFTYNGNCVITLSGSASSRINTLPSHDFAVDALSYNKTSVDTALSGKQDTLTAGTGIDITDNVISATGGGGASSLTDIAEAGNGITFAGNGSVTDNYTLVGSPTITDEVASGFSNSNYLIASISDTYSSGNVTSFEIEIDITTPASMTGAQRVLNWTGGSDSIYGPFIQANSEEGILLVFYTGSYYGFTAVPNPSANTRYQCKWVYDGTNVKSYYKLPTDDDWTLNSTDACSSSIPRFAYTDFTIGTREDGGTTVFLGSCNLLNFKIDINGSNVWTACTVVPDTKTIISTSLEDVATAGSGITFTGNGSTTENFSIVGTGCTVTDGVATGFDWYNTKTGIGTDYKTAPGNSTWEFGTKVTTAGDLGNTTQSFLGTISGVDNQTPVGMIDSGKFKLFLSSTGSSWDIANATAGSYSVQTNTTYWVKIYFNGSKYVLAYSTDGENFTDDIIINSSTPIVNSTTAKLAIGVDVYDSTNNSIYWRGSIDLKETYFKVDGVIDWEAYTVVPDTKTIVSADIGSGASAPTTSTAGYVGKLYVTTGGDVYICTGESGGTYGWKQVSVS